MLHISDRLKYFDSSEFQEVFRRQQQLKDPIDLSIGVPEELTPAHIKLAGIRAIEKDHTTYTPANGLPELREAIARKMAEKNSVHLDPRQVTVVPGLTTGLLLLYLAILDPGDEIIVMDPAYPPYEALATAIGAEVMTVLTLPTFHPDIPAIEASITNRTRAIILNTPNNPTGTVYTKEDMIALAEIADKRGIWLISDEIYEHFVYEGEHFSVASVYPNTITMNGFSKGYAMTGWRLGYITGPQQVIDAINQLQQYIVFSSSSIAQYAAIEAMNKPIVTDYKKYHAKRDLVVKRLTEMGLAVHGAQGAYYVFFQAPFGLTDLEFVERAAERNVLVLPGRAFSTRHGYVRISYGTSLEQLQKGMDVIEQLIKDLGATHD
jgi:aspartate/methionine/tyrosine aminotransferase